MSYFTYARGFRGGGFNGGARTLAALVPFKPEFVDSFELGLKTIAFDRRATLNLSLYYAKRTDQQVPQLVIETCGPDDPPPASRAPDALTTNAAKSSSRGFEIELQSRPIDGLQITGSVGYTNAALRRVFRTRRMDHRRGGRPLRPALPFIVPWQTHLAVQYSFEGPTLRRPWLEGWITPRIDWSWESAVDNWQPEITELHQPATTCSTSDSPTTSTTTAARWRSSPRTDRHRILQGLAGRTDPGHRHGDPLLRPTPHLRCGAQSQVLGFDEGITPCTP